MTEQLIMKLMTWDWKEQVDLEQLGQIVTEISGGTVHLYEVDTESDQYGLIVSRDELTQDQVQALWKARWADYD